MAEVEIKGDAGPVGGSHFAIPTLVVDGLARVLHVYGRDDRVRHGVEMIAGRLLDFAACLDWIATTSDCDRPHALRAQHEQGRLLGAMTSYSVGCIRAMWDGVPVILDRACATKRGQLQSTSYTKLLNGLQHGKWSSLLPLEIRNGIIASADCYQLCQGIRDEMLHRGAEAVAWFHADGPWIHYSRRGRDLIGPSRPDGAIPWYSVYALLRELLLGWLALWRPVSTHAPFANVKPARLHGFGADTVARLAELVGNGSTDDGWWFAWPCGPGCAGGLGVCQQPPGPPPSTVGRFARRADT